MTNVTSFQEASIKIHASLLTPENKLKLFYPVSSTNDTIIYISASLQLTPVLPN